MEIKFKKMIKKILILIVFLCSLNCKNKEEDKNILDSKTDTTTISSSKDECGIPQEIIAYITSSKEFELLTIKDLKLLKEYVNISLCSVYTKGDFNQNGNEDIAMVIRYKGYKNKTYPSYVFPFLIIFNDYKNGIKPNIIYKTGDYAEEDIKTVIYDQFEEGIFSYIEKDKVCDREVVKIILPEKSTFYVYWNSNKSTFELVNSLDEDFCKKIKGTNDPSDINAGKMIDNDSDNEVCVLNDISKQFNFKVTAFHDTINKNNPNPWKSKIVISNKKDNSKNQEIEFIPESWSLFDNIPCNAFKVDDYNFDGLDDFTFMLDTGGNTGPVFSYFFQNKKGQFIKEESFQFQDGPLPKKIDSKNKTLTIGISIFQLDNQKKWKQINR
jgi:hypothetical protein